LTAYADLERGLGATFFVIPFKGRPGRACQGKVSPRRAAAYEPSEIGDELRQLVAAGHEVGVHGLDAWCDRASGCAERQKIADVTGARELGVRMHWLWFDDQSPAALEQAGFSYDSTVGYNQTVGFRAGTTQAYRPLNATRLMELPLHVMDTALFYPSYLDLSPTVARGLVGSLLDHAERFGGALTVNWHDRSIAPERLWGGFYRWLIQELKERGAWFPTASQAVAWFRKRRSVVFESVTWEAGNLKLRMSGADAGDGPAFRLRVHPPQRKGGEREKFVDLPCPNGELAIAV
jgi:peptidoglycan/xylan/chitin deacetylase (PgdA/CDA1 family)